MTASSGVKERAAQRLPLQEQRVCSVPGCGRLSQRSAGAGLSFRLCKRCAGRLARHGSAHTRCYTAAQLRPYKTAARVWLKAHRSEVASALASLQHLMDSAGPLINAYSLSGLTAQERASAALARLRDGHVPAERLLEAHLAVSAAVADKGPHSHEYLIVGLAKCVIRKGSGTHRSTSGISMKSRYPHSSGRYLRVLGQRIWDIASMSIDTAAIAAVVAAARPAVAVANNEALVRAAAEERVAREILRVRDWDWGPNRLEQYRLQLRRQNGLS